MLSNCKDCQYYKEPIHKGDLACAIAPSYNQMWGHLQALPSNAIAGFPIDDCTDFERRLPYQLDDPCIRRSPQGNWCFMKRIRNGWGETCIEYESLTQLLTTEQVSIAGSQSDLAGDFFWLHPTQPRRSPPHSNSPNSLRQQAQEVVDRVTMLAVSSSHIDSIGYDFLSEILLIQFYDSGLYAYLGVPPMIWDGLQNSPSKGRFRHQNIEGRYNYLRI